jgi:lysozyme family protein
MNTNFEQCLAFLLKEEGGYVNDPLDPGGITNFGVTKKTWESWVGHEVTEDDMRSLNPEMVAPLYRANYWNAIHGDSLPLGVDYATFDFAVNSGTRHAATTLQRIVGVDADGVIGPSTLSAIQAINPVDLSSQICDNRLAYLQSLPGWAHDGHGWSNRIAFVRQNAMKMAG